MVPPLPSPWTRFQPPRQSIRPLPGPRGRAYRLAVSQPAGPAPAAGFPALMVLDGGRFFQAAAAAAEALAQRPQKTGIEPLVVIGLCHDETGEALQEARARDFTDAACADPSQPHAAAGGEAALFRRFLADQVLPAAQEVAPLDPARRALFGHSLGGLFVLETLEADPALFAHWIGISPSLWWNMPPATHAGAALLLGYGEMETARDMRGRIESWAEMAAARGRAPRLLMAARADHGAAPFALLPDALRHACRTDG